MLPTYKASAMVLVETPRQKTWQWVRPFTSERPTPPLAERQGFEPWVRLSTDNSLAVSPIRPLSHLSLPLLGTSWTHSPKS
jgi:hypothetical protein